MERDIISQQQNIIEELRRIFGDQRIPGEIKVHHHQEPGKNLENLKILRETLSKIEKFHQIISRNYEHESFSVNKDTSPTNPQETDYSDPIPICIPNNYEWNVLEHKLELLEHVPRTGIKTCQQGIELLRSISGPVCIVCVVGPARTGKSYLLSQLQGSRFRLGHTMRAETMGIWLGQKIIEHRTPSGENISVVFFDTEGIGSMDSKDSTEATDNQIFTLSTLLSSLLIYNSRNVPNNTDLEKLHFVSMLSESIRVRNHTQNTREDVQKFKQYAPDFFWLIRDVTLAITDKDNKPIDINKYLEQEILRQEGGFEEGVHRRDEIRSNIKSFFKSVNAFTLPLPSDEKKVLQNMGNPENNKNLNKYFLTRLDILKTTIIEKYHSKRGMNNFLFNGNQLADMLEIYSRLLNDKGYVPDCQSAWQLTVQMAYKRAEEKALHYYKTSMEPMRPTFPCKQDIIMEKHEGYIVEAINIFRNETLMDTDMDNCQKNLKQFTDKCATFGSTAGECTGGLLHELLMTNKERSMELCSSKMACLVKCNLEPLLSNINHNTSYEKIVSVIQGIEKQYWEQALGPAAGEVFKKFYEDILEKQKQIKQTVSQLSDYHEKEERAKAEEMRAKMLSDEIEQQKQEIQRQKDAQAKQHLAQVQSMKDAADRQIEQLQQERKRDMMEQRNLLSRQHDANVSMLREQQAVAQANTNQQLQHCQQNLTNLNIQLTNAKAEVEQLKNRQRVVIHRGGRGGGCSVQ